MVRWLFKSGNLTIFKPEREAVFSCFSLKNSCFFECYRHYTFAGMLVASPIAVLMKKNNEQNPILSRLTVKSVMWRSLALVCLIVTGLFILAPVLAAADIKGESYAYNLANFNGVIHSQWANIYVDKERHETYVVDTTTRDIKIFDKNGMETYVFGDDGSLGYVSDITVDKDGNIILISRTSKDNAIIRCNYRGQPVSRIQLKDLPPGFSRFTPNRIVYREGKLYLAETSALKIGVTDMHGVFETGYDIAPLIKVADSKRDENEITGFSVDRDGNILFTISVAFQAYRLSPDGTLDSFGKAGGGPGAFGVAAGIATDHKGFIYVSDKLRCVVSIFDNEFNYIREFGYRGDRPGNLVVPNDIDIDNDGTVYVSQGASRGISVYKMQYTND